MAEQGKRKSLSLKRPRVTSSEQENCTKSNKTVDRPQITSSDQEDSEKIETDNGPCATPCNPETSKKRDKTDDRYLFDVIFDDLTRLKEGECPANTEKNTEWVNKNFESWRSARNQRYPEEQYASNVHIF